jgi:RNA polymerase sigma factor (TIGR02999 family)
MPAANAHEDTITRRLQDWNRGDANGIGQVVTGLFPDLHRIAAGILAAERPGHTLQPTALINELYLRLVDGTPPGCHSRAHFLAVAAGAFRRILIDHARARHAQRRGGKESKVPLDGIEIGVPCAYEDLLIIDEALARLDQAFPRAARVTELRFFGGLQEDEVAAELKVSEITVKRDWKFARAWLASHLAARHSEEEE